MSFIDYLNRDLNLTADSSGMTPIVNQIRLHGPRIEWSDEVD